MTDAQQIDRRLAAAALDKNRRGQKPSREELRALRRVTAAEEERKRWEHYAAIPKKHYIELSGRQSRTLNQQAEIYGIPIGGRTIELGRVLKWLHDFLAKHKHRFAAEADDPLLEGMDQSLKDALVREQIKEKREKAKLAGMQRLEREGALVGRQESHQAWARVAGILRSKGEALQRQFGPDALTLLNEALSDAQREVDRCFGTGDAAGGHQ